MNAKIQKFLSLETEKLEILKALRASDLEDLTLNELYELFVVQRVSELYPNYDEFQEFLSYETFQLISFKALEAIFVYNRKVEKAEELMGRLDRKRSYRVGFSTIKRLCETYNLPLNSLRKNGLGIGCYLTSDFNNLVNILDFIWEREGNFDFITPSGWVLVGRNPIKFVDVTYSYDGNGGLEGQCLDIADFDIVCWDSNGIYTKLKDVMANKVFSSEQECLNANIKNITK